MARSRITMLKPLVPKSNGRTIQMPAIQGTVDPIYNSEEYKHWRQRVIGNAGSRCQWVESGERCAKAAPSSRMFADHIKELRDGGDPFDPYNGQCLCGRHHTLKTAQARAKRAGLRGV